MTGGDATIACIVEGHGDEIAVPVLLRRVANEVFDEPWVEVPRPIRQHRGRLLRAGELERTTDLAARRVQTARGGVLIVVDADDDCAARLAPELLARAREHSRGVPVAVVLAIKEFEAWFLAAASSLAGRRSLAAELLDHDTPEAVRDAKGWLTRHQPHGHTYSPALDQASLAEAVDLHLARRRAPSFDKFVRSAGELLQARRPQ